MKLGICLVKNLSLGKKLKGKNILSKGKSSTYRPISTNSILSDAKHSKCLPAAFHPHLLVSTLLTLLIQLLSKAFLKLAKAFNVQKVVCWFDSFEGLDHQLQIVSDVPLCWSTLLFVLFLAIAFTHASSLVSFGKSKLTSNPSSLRSSLNFNIILLLCFVIERSSEPPPNSW